MTDSAIKEMREEIINLSNRGSQVLDDLREIVILLEAKGYTKSKTIEFLKMKNINKGRLDYSFKIKPITKTSVLKCFEYILNYAV